jgi:hypothetical protein
MALDNVAYCPANMGEAATFYDCLVEIERAGATS